MMDIKNLTTFIHVAELNSFTKTAEALGYSQSTVSFQIRQLEAELNTQLFERINHTISLTENGREVLRYAHQIRKMTRELEESMSQDRVIRGHVRLAMADSICSSLLGEDFYGFHRQYPEISLKIITAGTEEMLRLLNHNEVDLILTLDNHIYNTEYVILGEEKAGMHFVAGAETKWSRMGHIAIPELVKEPFILTEKGMSYRRILEEKLAARSLEIQPILEIGSPSLICSLIKQGVGVSYLPDYVTAGDIQAGSMVYLEAEDLGIEVWKQLIYHRDKWVSHQMESVIGYCMEREFRAFSYETKAAALYSTGSQPRSQTPPR